MLAGARAFLLISILLFVFVRVIHSVYVMLVSNQYAEACV